MRKVHCPLCGVIVYASAGALKRSGMPTCGCGEPLQLANMRDRAVIEWDALQQELESYGPDAFDNAMRAMGFTDMIGRKREGRSGAGQHRCAWEHGYCQVFVSGTYCEEHEPRNRAEAAPAYRRAA